MSATKSYLEDLSVGLGHGGAITPYVTAVALQRQADPAFLAHARSITRPPGQHLPLPIAEAPWPIVSLFTEWIRAGRPYHLENALRGLLQPYRGTWLLTPTACLRLQKVSDRNDVIRFEPRSSPIRRSRAVAIAEPAETAITTSKASSTLEKVHAIQ